MGICLRDFLVDLLANTGGHETPARLRSGPSGITGGASSSGSGLSTLPDQYNSVWDISTTVTDAAGTPITAVRQGVRALLNKAQFEALCNTTGPTP